MIDWEKEYKDLTEVVDFTESKLIPTQLHIRALHEYFHSKNSPGYTEVNNWLWMASSLKNVVFCEVPDKYTYFFNTSEIEHEEKKQMLHHNLINELTKLLYLNNGFEALLNTFTMPECPNHKGKINAVNYLIKEKALPSLPFYKETLGNLRECLERSSLKKFINYFKEDSCSNINGVGLKIVYIIKNKLAHFDYQNPEPGDWSHDLPLESEITKLLSRISLMTIQMMLLANNKGKYDKLVLVDSKVIEYDEETEWKIDEFTFLWSVHVTKQEQSKIQMEIKFD